MRELIVDLRGVDPKGEETWADCPGKAILENAMLDHAGKVIRIKITWIKRYGYRDKNGRLH